MGTEVFPPREQSEPEVDNDGVALNGTEIQKLVCADLEGLLQLVTEQLASQSDLRGLYAYPRVRWRVQIEIIPFWRDEKPVDLEIEGGAPAGMAGPGEPIVLTKDQPIVKDPDAMRPEKAAKPKVEEEASAKPQHLNPMVRIGHRA